MGITGTSVLTGATTLTGNVTASTGLEVVDDFAVATTTNTFDFAVVSATSTFVGTGTTTAVFITSQDSTGGQIIIQDSDGGGCTAIKAVNGVLEAGVILCPEL